MYEQIMTKSMAPIRQVSCPHNKNGFSALAPLLQDAALSVRRSPLREEGGGADFIDCRRRPK